MSSVGMVAIGRNEAKRLDRCLRSVPASAAAVAYVDSASSDGSAEIARSHGISVVELDTSTPLSAARARNAGIARLREIATDLEFVLVIDADCELAPGFVDAALAEMARGPDVAIVCGRRRESEPKRSIFNLLCDMEWNVPIGDATACGGDAVIRLDPFVQIGGYDETLIAGEEPEMCSRLRRRGWRVRVIDHDMTFHDAAITHFRQWWKRAVRAGHAYAESFFRHGLWPREVFSIVAYAFVVPAAVAALVIPTRGLSLLGCAAYGWLYFRIRGHRLAHGDAVSDASAYARYGVLAKFPQLSGIAKYLHGQLVGRPSRIIEYKAPAVPGDPPAR
jgi:glycosyltransferase involved in cell wall biosynthesis